MGSRAHAHSFEVNPDVPQATSLISPDITFHAPPFPPREFETGYRINRIS
jgi:hypothetical protein